MKKIVHIIFLLLSAYGAVAQIVTTIAGFEEYGYSGDGGEAIHAKLNRPTAAKGKDGSGSIYFADSKNSVIRKVTAAGIISTVVGNGIGGYEGDGGQALSAKLGLPTDIIFDNAGNMYFTDGDYHTIRKVSTSGIITTIAGNGTPGFSGDNGPATAAKLSDPFGMVFDKKGNLIFSDGGNHRIRKIDPSGIITTIAGKGTNGYSGDGGPATAAEFKIPCYLAINAIGEIIVPDWMNNRLRKIDTFGIVTTIAGDGTAAHSPDGSLAVSNSIHSPCAVVIDNANNMIISSFGGYKIRKINTAGIVTTVAGTGISGYSGDGGLPINAQFKQEALCLHIDNWGNYYITDRENHRIRKIINNVEIDDFSKNEIKATIYPNPVSKEVTITADKLIKNITVINMLGQAVIDKATTKKEISLDVSQLPPGIYVVKVGSVNVGQFVKE